MATTKKATTKAAEKETKDTAVKETKTTAKKTATKTAKAETKVETKADEKSEKAPAKKAPAKKAAPKKVAPKKPASVAAATKAAKEAKVEATPVDTKVNFFVEFAGIQVSVDEVVNNVKATLGKDAKEIAVYLKPEESKAYFVADGETMEMDVYFC